MYNKVSCMICNKKLYKITNTHSKTHNITREEYNKKFPNNIIEDKQLALDRQKHKRGKKYSEIYGEELSKKMIQTKKEKLTKYKIEERKCKNCKKIYSVKESSTQEYCSVKCTYESLRKEKKKLSCLYCKSDFYDFPSSTKKFCSTKCVIDYRSKMSNTKYSCLSCGKILDVKIRDIAHNNNMFCDDDCKKLYNSLKRKTDYRQKAYNTYGRICSRCNTTENLVVHHKDGNRLYNDIDNLEIFCRKCHSHIHKEIIELQKQFVGQADIENGMVQMLFGLQKAFGLDITNENFRLTPKRVARAYYEIFRGINNTEELKNITDTSFPSDYDGMIIVDNIKCFSMCPHHFLPVEYIIDVGYIPNKKTVGLSKLSRVVELLAKMPELQETYTNNITNLLEKELKPKGTMVRVRGRHLCMAMRGVKKTDSWTLTTSLTGAFKKDHATRAELLALLNKR